MKPKTMFASRSLLEHIARGSGGLSLLWVAIKLSSTHPVISIFVGILTLYLLRGCPICWAIGLFETSYRTYAKIRHRRAI
ncbi:hypothetical protein EJA03_13385 [Vibrio pectenicida]|uniref:DUF2892 domain-containing protein n=1 Tax=Vibrio pectenicida TaxID=62763 RepID=A0A427U1M4_9VIBR|nr:hypothetical protein EJA03_13385 [Vibrio pectenicida]